jgi:hypothetical protein
MLPLISDFLSQNTTIFVIKLGDAVNARWTLCDQSTLDEHWHHFSEIVLSRKGFDILD